MATFANVLSVAGLTTLVPSRDIREDLVALIKNVDPVDTPLFSMSGDTRARSVFHEWGNDDLAAAAITSATEGATFTAGVLTRPTRVTNVCAIFRKDFAVTYTEKEIAHITGEDPSAYHMAKKMKEMARDTEAALVQSITANLTQPRTLKGLSGFITTNSVAGTVASILSRQNFFDLQRTVHSASGVQPGLALLHPTHKQVVSSWYTSITREMGNLSQSLGVTITEAVTDFGPVRFAMERYVLSPNSTTYTGYLVPIEMVKKAWLQPTFSVQQKDDGDMTPYMLMQELTLEYGHEKAFGRFTASTITATF